MLAFAKMSALSAVLSFVIVTAYNHDRALAEASHSGKLYHDRVPTESGNAPPAIRLAYLSDGGSVTTGGSKGDRLVAASQDQCGAKAWPYVAQACLTRDDGRPRPGHVRVITVETRQGPSTSLLARIPQTDVAQR